MCSPTEPSFFVAAKVFEGPTEGDLAEVYSEAIAGRASVPRLAPGVSASDV